MEYTRIGDTRLEGTGERFTLEADQVFRAIGQTLLPGDLNGAASDGDLQITAGHIATIDRPRHHPYAGRLGRWRLHRRRRRPHRHRRSPWPRCRRGDQHEPAGGGGLRSAMNSSRDNFACLRIDRMVPCGTDFAPWSATITLLSGTSGLRRTWWLPLIRSIRYPPFCRAFKTRFEDRPQSAFATSGRLCDSNALFYNLHVGGYFFALVAAEFERQCNRLGSHLHRMLFVFTKADDLGKRRHRTVNPPSGSGRRCTV